MQLVIEGSVPSKKNSRITTRSGKTFPNKRYTDWEKAALLQLSAQQWERIAEGTVALTCMFYVKDEAHRDLDNMLSSVLDVIKDQKKRVSGKMITVREGVVADDCWHLVRPITLDAALDRKNPRVELTLVVRP